MNVRIKFYFICKCIKVKFIPNAYFGCLARRRCFHFVCAILQHNCRQTTMITICLAAACHITAAHHTSVYFTPSQKQSSWCCKSHKDTSCSAKAIPQANSNSDMPNVIFFKLLAPAILCHALPHCITAAACSIICFAAAQTNLLRIIMTTKWAKNPSKFFFLILFSFYIFYFFIVARTTLSLFCKNDKKKFRKIKCRKNWMPLTVTMLCELSNWVSFRFNSLWPSQSQQWANRAAKRPPKLLKFKFIAKI